MTNFTVKHGHRYTCDIDLTGFETWASNDMIVSRFKGYGFTDVIVKGNGAVRQGEGTWSGPTLSQDIDSHLTNIREIYFSSSQ